MTPQAEADAIVGLTVLGLWQRAEVVRMTGRWSCYATGDSDQPVVTLYLPDAGRFMGQQRVRVRKGVVTYAGPTADRVYGAELRRTA